MGLSAKTPPVLIIKQDDAKKSDVWSTAAKQRFMKQHGTLDVHELPESDAHAVKKYQDPTYRPPASAEAIKAAEDALEQKIKALKEQGQTTVPKKTTDGNFYDEWVD